MSVSCRITWSWPKWVNLNRTTAGVVHVAYASFSKMQKASTNIV